MIDSESITFLFTDIEGSTQLWEQHPETMKLALARHDAILRGAMETHGGHVFKTVGDAFYAAFASAPQALAAALEAQRALHAENWGEAPIRVRIALYTGAAEARNGDYFGPPLNRVARLIAAGHGGQMLLSAATAELLREHLPPSVELRDMGERRLKDLTRPEHIYQVLAAGLPADFPPLRALDAFRTNLPAQLTSFVGREKEIVAVKQLITTNTSTDSPVPAVHRPASGAGLAQAVPSRLTTLTGPGGTGKTRLSLQVAADLLDSFPDGVWFVELASLSDPALITQTVLATLGLREEAGRSPLHVLTNYLQEKKTLLILDNCEHLVEASAQLAENLLEACPNLQMLVSSREALGIPGETPYRVPSLSIPDVHHLLSIEMFAEYEAVRLFVDRAKTALPAFTITNENAPTIAQICARLDGIPLAIELAAARVKMLKVEQIAERLDDRFRLLTGGSRTALPRQQTLRALIDWSHDLLSAPERALLRRLSVFSGGWALEAAETVCASAKDEGGNTKDEVRRMKDEENLPTSSFILHPFDLRPSDVLDLLTQLINKSLVAVDADIVPAGYIMPAGYGSAETRYRLLETVRQYAREKLLEAGEGISIRDRHLNYFMQLAERAEPEFIGPDQVRWMKRMDMELDNLRVALEWALERDVQAGLRLASALRWFWVTYDHIRDGSDKLAELLIQPPALARTPVRAKALATQSYLVPYFEDYNQSHTLVEESLSIYQELGDRRGIAESLLIKATSVETLEIGRVLIDESLAHYRALDDKPGLSWALGVRGEFADNQNYAEAKYYMEQSLAICRELGHVAGIGVNLINLGTFAVRHGDYALARTWLEEAAQVNRPLGRVRMAETMLALGDLEFRDGHHELARAYLEEVVSVMKETGHVITGNWTLARLGHIAASVGAAAQAKEFFKEALRRFKEEGNRVGIVYTLEGVAKLAVQEGQPERAARLLAWADETRMIVGDSRPMVEQVDVDMDLATIHTQLDEATFAAEQTLGRALSVDEAVAYGLESIHPSKGHDIGRAR